MEGGAGSVVGRREGGMGQTKGGAGSGRSGWEGSVEQMEGGARSGGEGGVDGVDGWASIEGGCPLLATSHL